MQYTTNYNLNKPDLTDNFDTDHQNNNMDAIDTQLKANADNIALKASKIQPTWITPTLLNGWTEVSGYPVRYKKDEFGNVWIKGRVQGGTIGNAIFVLPNGYRSLNSDIAFFASTSGASTRIFIFQSGNVITQSFATYITLDAISFVAEV